jgi:hypothetical protein
MHTHLSVPTFSSESPLGPERATELLPLSPLHLSLVLPSSPLLLIVSLLSGFLQIHMLYLALVLSHLCCLILFRIPPATPEPGFPIPVSSSRSRSFFLVTPTSDSPLAPMFPTSFYPNGLSLLLLSCFHHSTSNVLPSLN